MKARGARRLIAWAVAELGWTVVLLICGVGLLGYLAFVGLFLPRIILSKEDAGIFRPLGSIFNKLSGTGPTTAARVLGGICLAGAVALGFLIPPNMPLGGKELRDYEQAIIAEMKTYNSPYTFEIDRSEIAVSHPNSDKTSYFSVRDAYPDEPRLVAKEILEWADADFEVDSKYRTQPNSKQPSETAANKSPVSAPQTNAQAQALAGPQASWQGDQVMVTATPPPQNPLAAPAAATPAPAAT
ncbi:MAG: hypothetical protein V2A74_15020, partial [bacterium]